MVVDLTSRNKGITGIIRHIGDNKILEQCIQSTQGFFDETIVIYTPINGHQPPKIKDVTFLLYDIRCKRPIKDRYQSKPLQPIRDIKELIQHTRKPLDAYSFASLSNLGIALCRHSHVAPMWDSDMILLKEFNNDEFYDYVVNHRHVAIRGYLLHDDGSKTIEGYHPRFWQYNKQLYFSEDQLGYDMVSYRMNPKWLRSPHYWMLYPRQSIGMCRNILGKQDVWYPDPVYDHYKLIVKRGIQCNKPSTSS